MQNVEHRLRVDGHRHALGQLAFLALAIDDSGQAAGRAQAARFVFPAAFSLDYFERCIHIFPVYRNAFTALLIQTTKRPMSPREYS